MSGQNKKRVLFVTVACALAFCVTAAAMAVDKFTDYNPPGTLSITWGDYRVGSMSGNISADNKVSDWAEQTAAYPYRAFFYGGKPASATVRDKYHGYVFVVYSKKPVDSVLTFQYLDGNKPVANTGYIKATYDRELVQNGDIIIKYASWGDYVSGGTLECSALAIWSNYYNSSKSSTYTGWFEFDFYYACTDKHQQNTQLLTIPGLRSIANVPYAYILTCDAHGHAGGAESGSSSDNSSGGNGSGGDSPGGSGENPSGGGGSPGGSGDGGYGNDPGDTGESGNHWTLPKFSDNDGVSGEAKGYQDLQPGTGDWGYGELKPGGNGWGYGELIPGGDGWGYTEYSVDAQWGLIDFMR